ncbi:CopG family transcriptional regulator [bacterium]|nr:CopG family transcriptional regulator [bacterium]
MIGVRISKELRVELEKIAKEEQRPLSNLIRLILTKWVEKNKEKPKK